MTRNTTGAVHLLSRRARLLPTESRGGAQPGKAFFTPSDLYIARGGQTGSRFLEMGASVWERGGLRRYGARRGTGGHGGEFSASRGDLSAGPGDFSAGRGDFSAGSGDFSAGPGDFSAVPGDFSAVPGDFSAVPGDFSAVPGDFSAGRGDFSARRGEFPADGRDFPGHGGEFSGVRGEFSARGGEFSADGREFPAHGGDFSALERAAFDLEPRRRPARSEEPNREVERPHVFPRPPVQVEPIVERHRPDRRRHP